MIVEKKGHTSQLLFMSQWGERKSCLAKLSSRKISVRYVGSCLIIGMVRRGEAHLLVEVHLLEYTEKNFQQCRLSVYLVLPPSWLMQ